MVELQEKTQYIKTENCGDLMVHIQGDLSQQENKAVFLTVHDLGSNHTSFKTFIDHPSMVEVKSKSIFIHVIVPGQEDSASDLPDSFKFPTLAQIGQELVMVLDELNVKCVVGLGEGAGANILVRFAIFHTSRCLGLVLIHCTASVAGFTETVKDKFINNRLNNIGMNSYAESYLLFHRYGYILDERIESGEDKEKLIKEFQERLNKAVNPRNLTKFVDAFLKRTDITSMLEKNLKVDCLLIDGTKSSYLHTMDNMFSHLNKEKSQMIKVDGVGHVMEEAPAKMTHSLILFTQGLGLLTAVPTNPEERSRTMSGSSMDSETGDKNKRRSRTMSMEEFDRPCIRRLSLVATKTASQENTVDE